mmetsp:Transcript_432/g.1620  ORF Transcript_432/g.1620 Transcript_432/m.1620 type:complete len:403 (-) Transcript_432:13-1221(-)
MKSALSGHDLAGHGLNNLVVNLEGHVLVRPPAGLVRSPALLQGVPQAPLIGHPELGHSGPGLGEEVVGVPEREGLLPLHANLLGVVVDDLDVVNTGGSGGQLHKPVQGDTPVPDTVEKAPMGALVLHGEADHLGHVLDLGDVSDAHAVAWDGHGPAPGDPVEEPLLAVLVVGITGDVLGPEDGLSDAGALEVVLHGDVAGGLLDGVALDVRWGDARLVDSGGADVQELRGSLAHGPVDHGLARVEVLPVVVHDDVVLSRGAGRAVGRGSPHRLHAKARELVEPAEGLLLHLVAGLVTRDHDGHVVVLLRELLGKMEADDGVSTAWGVDHEDAGVRAHVLAVRSGPPGPQARGLGKDGLGPSGGPPGTADLVRGHPRCKSSHSRLPWSLSTLTLSLSLSLSLC